MDSEMIQETPYTAAMNGDWESMVDYYKKNLQYLFSRVTLSLDTGFHLAVHSNEEQPLKDLLGIMKEREFFLPETRNKFGNTVLHEATIYGNYEAVRLLVERCPDLLWIPNEVGETPLFTAAAFGEAEMVEFLIRSKPEQCVDDNGHLLSNHRQRWKDGLSILGAAIIGQHFETALLLLELDESLHSLKDDKDRTALQLLADMPSAFKSAYSMGIFETLFYCCLPVIRHHEVVLQVETRGQAGQVVRDLESGLGRNQRGGLLNYLKISHEEPSAKQRKDKKKNKTVDPHSQVKQGDQKQGKEEEQGMGGGKNKKGENEFPAERREEGKTSENTSKETEIEEVQHPTAQPSVTNSSLIRKEEIPMLIATRNGIEEIVGEIIKQHPHAIEQLNDEGQSILDVAVMHRQEEIFSLVKEQRIPC
ncbi:uncharacterized protein [Populus alba]